MPEPRPFAAVMAEMGRGATVARLSEALRECALAVREHGGMSTLTLKLTMKGQGDGSVLMQDNIKTVVPDADRGKSVFFVTEQGDLQRTDPQQPDLPHIHRVGGEKS